MEQNEFSLIKMISDCSLSLKQPDLDTCYNKPFQIDSN